MRLNVLIRRVETVRRGMNDMVRAACQRRSGWIVKANQSQLKKGVNTDGILMNHGRYSRSHKWARQWVGLPVDHVYLSFQGDLQEGMYVKFSETGFEIATTDWKQWMVDYTMDTGYWPSLGNTPRYGPVFGLTAANKIRLGNVIKPRVVGSIRRKLGVR